MPRRNDGKDNKLETLLKQEEEQITQPELYTATILSCLINTKSTSTYGTLGIWDLARDAYQDAYQDANLVEMLVDGKLPQNWGMSQSLDSHREKFEHEQLETQRHGIIFFIPQMFGTDMDDDEQQRVKEVFQIRIKKCCSPMVVSMRSIANSAKILSKIPPWLTD